MKPGQFISDAPAGESQHSISYSNASNMKWQSSTTLGVTLTVLLLLQVAPSQAAPHHIPQHQQQLFYYNNVIPPQQRQAANVVIVPGNGAGIQQFAAAGVPLPVGGQYLLVQPEANPVLYVTRSESGDKPDEGGSGGGGGVFGGLLENFNNFISTVLPTLPPALQILPTTTEIPNNPAEKPEAEKPGSDNPEKPIKLVDGQASASAENSEQQSASLEKFDEDAPSPKPAAPGVPAPGQRFVVVGQPQFFGNYDALRNHAVQQGLGTNGAVSSFLLLRNQQVVPLASVANGKLQEEAGNSVAQIPGSSALEFQRYIQAAKQQHAQQQVTNVGSAPLGYQNVVYVARQPPQQNPSSADDSGSITVEALRAKPNVRKEGGEVTDADTEDVEANPPGPSVAQVKPQAIALAGPGGVAAAAPIGTALVGPGGLAVAAPSATAVAGPSGGAPPPPGAHSTAALSSPAAYKAYLLEQQAKGSYPRGTFHVAYNV